MCHRKPLFWMIGLGIILLILTGCHSSPAQPTLMVTLSPPTFTPVLPTIPSPSPTATPMPPTPTPSPPPPTPTVPTRTPTPTATPTATATPLSRAEQANSLNARGWEYAFRSRWDEAIAAANRAIELDPTNPHHYILRAFIYDAGFHKMDEAIADATRAIELAPALYDAWAERSAVYMHFGLHEQALADANQAIQIDPRRFEGYVHRGDVLHCLGRLDEAIADYSQAIVINPRSAWAHWTRGQVYERKGDLNAALTDYSRAISLEPKDRWTTGDFLFSRSGVYRALGQYQQALADCDAMLALVSNDPRGFYCRGLVEVALGQVDQARADFERAISLPPLKAWDAWVTEAAQAELSKLP